MAHHDDDDHAPPPLDDDCFEVVSTIRRRPPRRQVARELTAATAAPVPPRPATPALPQPATPHADPIAHILPHGSIATLSGASGVGKTALIAGLIRDIQAGIPFYGHLVTRPPQIGYIAADRPWRDHAQWFERAGCEPFPHYSLPDDKTFNWNRLRDWKQCSLVFCEALDRLQLPPGSLIIADPMPLFIPGRLIDYKDAAIGVRVLDAEGLQPRQLTMIGVFHVAKQKANKNDRYLRPQDRILGSGGQVGYSETAMYLMGPEDLDKSYSEFGWVPHQIKSESVQLKRDSNGLFIPYGDYDRAHDEGKLLRAVDCFQDGLIHAASIVLDRIQKTCGCSEPTARRTLNDLVRYGHVTRVQRGHYQLTTAFLSALGGDPPPPSTH